LENPRILAHLHVNFFTNRGYVRAQKTAV